MLAPRGLSHTAASFIELECGFDRGSVVIIPFDFLTRKKRGVGYCLDTCSIYRKSIRGRATIIFVDIQDFKKQYVQEELGINDEFKKILTFVDFGNVNYWFKEDRQTHEHIALADDEEFYINIEKLKEFLSLFSSGSRFYYGNDPANEKSLWFIQKVQSSFGKHSVFTKPMQKVRHYLETKIEQDSNTRALHHDREGDYVLLPKCNFDVEISVDAMKTIGGYDTICLLSGDADFVYLLRYLKQKGKKVILIKGGHIVHQLKDVANLVINAQDIKKYITEVKQKPGGEPGLADRNPESTGRTTVKS